MQHSQAPTARGFLFTAKTTFARVRGTRILGETPQSIVRDLEIARASRYSTNDQYDLVPSISLQKGSEGDVSVQKSRRTGNLFVVKHTNRICHPPTDANFARYILKAHPNIVVVHDLFKDPETPDRTGRWYIYMTACTGGDLLEQALYWHQRRNTETPRLFLYHAIVELLDTMAYIHYGLRHTVDGFYTQDRDHQCIVHGDLKPEQFFLDWSERTAGMPKIVLGDFGHAKIMGSTASSEYGLGTSGWMAPEQEAMLNSRVFGPDIVNARTPACDMYSIGLVIYVLAVQQGDGIENEWPTGQDEELLQLSREHGLRDIVYSCLRVDPKERASASFDKPNGIMELANRMRKARDNMIANGHAITEPTDWVRASL